MEIIDKLKQNAISSRKDNKISLLAKIKEDRLLKRISIIISNFIYVSSNFGYNFEDKERGFFLCMESLVAEAKSSEVWTESTYKSNAIGAAYFFSFLIIDNFPNSFNFKEVKGYFPQLAYVGNTVNIDISFNLTQTMYDILKGEKDISKLDTIYNLCDALYSGTFNAETIGQYVEN